MRGLTLLVIALLLAVGPGCTSSGPRPSSKPMVTVEMQSALAGPNAILKFGNRIQNGAIGSACWNQGNAVGCFDTVATVVVPTIYIDVPRGTILAISGDVRKVEGTIARLAGDQNRPLLDPVATLDLRDLRAPMEAPPGRYTLELVGTWGQGTAPAYFGIAIH